VLEPQPGGDFQRHEKASYRRDTVSRLVRSKRQAPVPSPLLKHGYLIVGFLTGRADLGTDGGPHGPDAASIGKKDEATKALGVISRFPSGRRSTHSEHLISDSLLRRGASLLSRALQPECRPVG